MPRHHLHHLGVEIVIVVEQEMPTMQEEEITDVQKHARLGCKGTEEDIMAGSVRESYGNFVCKTLKIDYDIKRK